MTDLLDHYQKCAVIMLSENFESNEEFSPLLAIANVLRIPADDDVLLAHPDENIIAYVIAVNSDMDKPKILNSFFADTEKRLHHVYSGAIRIEWKNIVSDCIFLDNSSIADAETDINRLIDTVLQKAVRLSSDFVDYHKQIMDLRHEMLENPQLEWNIDSISKTIGISRSHFQWLYKEMFHSGCIDDIINARIERAKWLLINTDMKIGEIAHNCGYVNESHFIRQFRSKTGVTATGYRKQK